MTTPLPTFCTEDKTLNVTSCEVVSFKQSCILLPKFFLENILTLPCVTLQPQLIIIAGSSLHVNRKAALFLIAALMIQRVQSHN